MDLGFLLLTHHHHSNSVCKGGAMGNQQSHQKFLVGIAGDTDTDDQEPVPNDAGRVRCALYDAASPQPDGNTTPKADLPMSWSSLCLGGFV
jgi:hypothetical protein